MGNENTGKDIATTNICVLIGTARTLFYRGKKKALEKPSSFEGPLVMTEQSI